MRFAEHVMQANFVVKLQVPQLYGQAIIKYYKIS
jgi:hypothetical protein